MIFVLGMVGDTYKELSLNALEKLSHAKSIVGNKKRIEGIVNYPHLQTNIKLVEFPKPLSQIGHTLEGLPRPAVVLASGDPGFFGIINLLKRSTTEDLEVIPSPSSISLASSRINISWEDMSVISGHGRPISVVRNRIAEAIGTGYGKVGILCGPTFTPNDALGVIHQMPTAVGEVWVFENLATATERITGPDAQFSDYDSNSVVILLGENYPESPSPSIERRGSGMEKKASSAFDDLALIHPDQNFTKLPARALILALLQVDLLPSGSTFLDVGAGHGGVGLVLKRIRPDINVILFEQSPSRARVCAQNAKLLNADVQIRTSQFSTLALTSEDFDPESISGIFFGGGGMKLADETMAQLHKQIHACATFTSPSLTSEALRIFGSVKQLNSYDIVTYGQHGNTRLSPSNPVFLAWNEPTK